MVSPIMVRIPIAPSLEIELSNRTRVYVRPTGRTIAPFNDPVGQTQVGNRSLEDWQKDAIESAGFMAVSELTPPCVVIPDTLFCTGQTLRDFVEGASGQNAVAVLMESRFGRLTTPVQPGVERITDGWRFREIRFDSGGSEPCKDVLLDPREKPFDVPVKNPYLGVETLEFSIAGAPLMTLHHWVHILWANQVYGGIDLLQGSRLMFGLRIVWAAIRALSLNKWKVMGKLNKIGKNCDIHPTAVIECSTLGDNVTVGPNARILLSTLGDGVDIMSGANVEFCTLGERSIVSENTVLRFSTLYAESVASQYLMQQCVLGRRAVTTSGAYSMDLNFDRDIRVPLDGQLHSTGQRFLGSAFGHNCRVGTGFWMASGRMIPNDYFVIRDPDAVLSRLPDGLSQGNPLAVRGRHLEPLGGVRSLPETAPSPLDSTPPSETPPADVR